MDIDILKREPSIRYGLMFENRVYKVKMGKRWDYDIQALADLIVRIDDPKLVKYRNPYEENKVSKSLEAKIVAKQFNFMSTISVKELVETEPRLDCLRKRSRTWSV